MPTTNVPVLQLRVIVEADDFDAAIAFYRDTLGLPEQAAFESAGDARVAILEAGRATLEISNPAQVRMIDDVEVGRRVAPKIRLAFEVTDAAGATRTLASAGATVIAEPTETPWRSLNSRLDAPAGLQITLFEELESLDERRERPGFGTDATRDRSPPPASAFRDRARSGAACAVLRGCAHDVPPRWYWNLERLAALRRSG